MQTGDLVRFRLFDRELPYPQPHKWYTGILVHYETWEKMARILYEGRMISVHARDVQLQKRLKVPTHKASRSLPE